MPLDAIALLIDTYWMFLLGALFLGVIVGWIAANTDSKASDTTT